MEDKKLRRLDYQIRFFRVVYLGLLLASLVIIVLQGAVMAWTITLVTSIAIRFFISPFLVRRYKKALMKNSGKI